MEEIFEKLKAFLPLDIKQQVTEYDENTYDLLDTQKGERIGMYVVNGSGELVGMSFDQDVEVGSLKKEEMLSIAGQFVKTFHPDKQKVYELSAILDLDNPYMISYEKRDEKYGLFLHSAGFTVTVSTAGQIHQFWYETEEYEVRYPEKMITDQDALEKYMEHVNFELVIQHYDADIFQNGDDQYHLSYHVSESVNDLPADGSKPEMFEDGNVELESINKQQAPKEGLYRLIDLPKDYHLLETVEEENQRIEIWSKSKDVTNYSTDLDEINAHIVKLSFDRTTGLLLQISRGDASEINEQAIGKEWALKKAFDVIFCLFPDANERFKFTMEPEYENVSEDLPEEEDWMEYEEDMEDAEFIESDEYLMDEEDLYNEDDQYEDFVDLEENYIFHFYLIHNGIRMDDHDSVIGIGKYSGKVNVVNIDGPKAELYQHLPNEPKISVNEARQIYQNLIKMQLHFVREYEGEKAVYTLSYVPSFPATTGHVRAIDANTGKAMYVDVGDGVFFN